MSDKDSTFRVDAEVNITADGFKVHIEAQKLNESIVRKQNLADKSGSTEPCSVANSQYDTPTITKTDDMQQKTAPIPPNSKNSTISVAFSLSTLYQTILSMMPLLAAIFIVLDLFVTYLAARTLSEKLGSVALLPRIMESLNGRIAVIFFLIFVFVLSSIAILIALDRNRTLMRINQERIGKSLLAVTVISIIAWAGYKFIALPWWLAGLVPLYSGTLAYLYTRKSLDGNKRWKSYIGRILLSFLYITLAIILFSVSLYSVLSPAYSKLSQFLVSNSITMGGYVDVFIYTLLSTALVMAFLSSYYWEKDGPHQKRALLFVFGLCLITLAVQLHRGVAQEYILQNLGYEFPISNHMTEIGKLCLNKSSASTIFYYTNRGQAYYRCYHLENPVTPLEQLRIKRFINESADTKQIPN